MHHIQFQKLETKIQTQHLHVINETI